MQLQQELLSARREIESQATQILALEETLLARPELPPDAPESEKDRLLGEQARNIRELEMVVKGYEDNLGAPLRAVREDVEREWGARLAAEEAKRKEADAWAAELARALDKEKKVCTVLPRATIPSQPSILLFFFRPDLTIHTTLRVG